jgi:Family of unknown function (DUF6506)
MKDTGRTKRAMIYESHHPALPQHRELRRADGEQHICSIAQPEDVIALASELAASGVTLIELCGGLSPSWRPKVSDAVNDGVSVCSITFGIESLMAAAEYNRLYLEGRPPKDAFMLLECSADANRDRFERKADPQHTIFLPVPDGRSAAGRVEGLLAEGVGLIELYGGFSDHDCAAIIEAVAGRAAVGIPSYPVAALA